MTPSQRIAVKEQISLLRLRKMIDNDLGKIQGVPATVEVKHAVDEYFEFLKNKGAISSYSTHFIVDPVVFNTVIQYFYIETVSCTQIRGIIGVQQYAGQCETPGSDSIVEDTEPDFMDLFRSFKQQQ